MSANKSKIDTSHQQIYQTCLLSSFAVVGNYFTNTPIEFYFENYFNEFISDFKAHNIQFQWPSFGLCQSAHINYLGPCTNRSGYNILYDLYSTSIQPEFVVARTKYFAEQIDIDKQTGIIIGGSFNGTYINDFLSDTGKNSIMSIFINGFVGILYNNPFDRYSMHSIVIYSDNNCLYIHDTGDPQNDIQINSFWYSFPRIGSIMIYWEK